MTPSTFYSILFYSILLVTYYVCQNFVIAAIFYQEVHLEMISSPVSHKKGTQIAHEQYD